MCLFTKNKFPSEALSKIYVYKVLLRQFTGSNNEDNTPKYRYLSPFTRDYQYNYGINEPVRNREEKDYYSVEDINYVSGDGYFRFVDTGWLHAFTVEEKAYALCNKFKERYPGLDFVVVKMYIPEHANYYLSENGFDICSNRLVCLPKCM